MSKNKKNYLWLIILLLVIVALFIIISKKEVLEEEEEVKTEILQIDKNKKSEGEVTKESLENLINQLKGNTETPSE
jgi:uncharacterized membrane protein